jgi:hypothetical protein
MSGTELQDLMFALLQFGLDVEPTIPPFYAPILPFGMGMFNLCHFILGVCNLFVILQGLTAKSLP